jgi:hypothetical protein
MMQARSIRRSVLAILATSLVAGLAPPARAEVRHLVIEGQHPRLAAAAPPTHWRHDDRGAWRPGGERFGWHGGHWPPHWGPRWQGRGSWHRPWWGGGAAWVPGRWAWTGWRWQWIPGHWR